MIFLISQRAGFASRMVEPETTSIAVDFENWEDDLQEIP
jgi:hypothetical protein